MINLSKYQKMAKVQEKVKKVNLLKKVKVNQRKARDRIL